jgi:hypothetical protein
MITQRRSKTHKLRKFSRTNLADQDKSWPCPVHDDATKQEPPMRECFPILIKARAPIVLCQAIKVAAEKELTTPSEWMRRALLRQLRENGIDLQTVSQRAA